MSKVLSFDIGGTFIKYAIVEKNDGIIFEEKFKSPATYEDLIKQITNIYADNKGEADNAICISCPSTYKDGKIIGSSFLQYIIGKDLVGDIETNTNTKCYIENDGNCAALGEYYFGVHKASNLATIVIGSGVGGGIIINDKLHRGHNQVGGELGFPLFNNELGESKPYNIFGSVTGMGNFIRRAIEIDKSISSAEDIFDSNNKQLEDIKIEECQIIAMQIMNLQYIIDPEVIVIGGAISQHTKFIEGIKEQLNKYYNKLPYHDTKSNVYACTHGNKSNILGATVEYWRDNE